ncbi:hypothetical protein HK100_000367 [Physocladia obscura]|uniref:Uncharacterized protein n=1 Tax=Physocladia obscura TaxID=109957 RepID=A0AAD5XBV1_9FUNG|nr:hypothetical protein HK100_000367 [Physocladia obscura]
MIRVGAIEKQGVGDLFNLKYLMSLEFARKRTAVEAEQHLADSVSEVRENIAGERTANKRPVTYQLESVLRIIPSSYNTPPDVLKLVSSAFAECDDLSFFRVVDLRTTNWAIFESVPSGVMESCSTSIEKQWSRPIVNYGLSGDYI